MIAQSFAVHFFSLLAGFGLVHLVWRSSGFRTFLLKIFLGAGVGLGITACLYFLRLLFLPGQGGFLLIQAIFLVLVFIALIWRRRISLDQSITRISVSSLQIPFVLLALTAIVVTVYYVLIFARITPHGDYDAQAIWNLRARFMFRLGNEWLDAFSPLINRNFHMDYPLLVPLNVLGSWNALGAEVLRAPAVLSMIFLFALAGVIFSGLALIRPVSQALLGLSLLLSTPLLLRYATFQTADIALTYYFLCAAVLFVIAGRETNPGLYFLSGLMASLSAWTKNEGVPFLFIVAVAIYLTAGKANRSQRLWSFAGGMALPVITLIVFKSLISSSNDIFVDNGISVILPKLFDPSRYGRIIRYLLVELNHLGGWPVSILLVLALYGLIMGKARLQILSERWVAIIPALQSCVYVFIYLVTPKDLDWHLNYSLSRLLMQIFPAALFTYLLFINPPERAFQNEAK